MMFFKKYGNLIYLILSIIYMEIIFNIFGFGLNVPSIYLVLFSVIIGGILELVLQIFKPKISRILSFGLITILSIFFSSQFVHYKFYSSIFSIYSMLNGGQVFEFANQIISVIINNWYVILLLFVPLIVRIILEIKKINLSYKRSFKNNVFVLVLICIIFIGIHISFYFSTSKELYSPKRLYHDLHVVILSCEEFGVLTTFRLDIQRSLFGFREKELDEIIKVDKEIEKMSEGEEISYNVEDIDFDELIDLETDEDIKNMHEYFKKETPTKKNEYTGYFEGKNLIVFVAEAFAPMAINKELTPTLYKLYNEGFQFNNFYTPLFPVSTADGEYMTDTSLIPKEGVWSLSKLEGNYMPYSYANVFENLGYNSYAYHNHKYSYYKRDSYINSMGYDSYRACGKGLNINCKIWPESDLEMINDSVYDYVHDDNFIAYYMTVSGHLEYTRLGNMMVVKNWDKVKDLPYSEKAKGYIAANIEFDKALEKLIEILELEGKLEDTVIAISGDHYPYGLSLNEINEISDYSKDENFEIHKMPFLIWNSGMKKPVAVDKFGSSLDVLPTLLNLFGITYDSRLLMGRDLMSDSKGLVIFSNRSFITEYGKYNSMTKDFTSFKNVEDIQNYIDLVSLEIYNKYKYSKLILEKDYYRYVFKKY